MSTLEAMRIALASLWANKLRSILTLLGVVIAVASIIAVVTLINGINAYVGERIFRLGADVFIVNKRPNVITNIDQLLEADKRKNITLEDYEAVAEICRTCKVLGASVGGQGGRIRYGSESITDTSVRGWTPTMARIYDLELIAGRSITDSDNGTSSNVAVIGHDIVDNLLPGLEPIGKEIRVDGQPFTVIGVGKREGSTLGQSRDNWVMMPANTWMKRYGNARTSIRIWGKAEGIGQSLQAAMDEVRVVLRTRRHDPPGARDSFEIDTNQTFLSIWASISQNFFIVTVAIASISLVVGGIVIMNIMLVSVTERTREIGVRKALGARRRDLMRQFIIESSTMAAVGGVIGVIVGSAVAKTITTLVGIPSSIELWSVVAGMVLATSVGLFFGVYPASRAANLDPIAALRFEL
jgi:putative ABC transport system permease protein